MKSELDNVIEKGATLQKDKKTYAIIPYLPGGIINPDGLRKIADVAEKYDINTIKMTSENKIGLFGIKTDDIDGIWEDLGMESGGFIGRCVRSSKVCLGNTYCKNGQLNSVKMGLKIDNKFHKLQTPQKIKIAVSGCPNSCSESYVKDIGLIGTKNGWKMYIGGTSGRRPRIGDQISKNLSDEEVLELMEKIFNYYIKTGIAKRIGHIIDEIGFENFSSKILDTSP